MTIRQKVAIASLAILGLLAAAAMGVLANAIAGDSIGLSAKSLRAGAQLAPARASRKSDRAEGRRPGRGHGQADRSKPAGSPTPTTTTTTTEPGDDHGGGLEPGDDHGGLGVDNSGPGSINSGSTGGSGHSGGGSDD
jgi:Tfp pilus assembly protein FimT